MRAATRSAIVLGLGCRPAHDELLAPAVEDKELAVVIEGEPVRMSNVVLSPDGPVVLGNAAPPFRIGDRTLDARGDGIVASFDWDGRLRWAQQLRSDAHVIVDGLTPLADGGVAFVGSFQHSLGLGDREVNGTEHRTCFVARVDARGTATSLHAFGGSQETLCRSIAVDGDTAWIVASFSGALQVGDREHVSRGILDVVVAHMQLSKGVLDGGFTFGTAREDVAREVLVTGDDLLIAGSYGGPGDANGNAGVAVADRALALSPAIVLEPVGDADAFIARFDRSGQPRWALRQAGPGFDVVKQIAALGDGFAATVCSQSAAPPAGVSGMVSEVPLGGWIVHFGADGVERWRWSDPAILTPAGIVATRRGVAFSGHYTDGLDAGGERWPARGTSDAMWIELDASGRFVRGDHCGSAGADHSDAIAVDREQRIWFGGGSEAGSTCTGDVAGGFLRRSSAPR